MMHSADYLPNPHVPHYPTYLQAHNLVRIMNGQSQRVFFDMRYTIEGHAGTPQETQDWTSPDEWIPQLLAGEEQRLAYMLWQESQG